MQHRLAGAPTEFDRGNIISDAVFYNDSAFPDVAETGCDSAPVTVRNRATATLYTYAPYQPNAAYPGEGDACSFYGNRNFFRIFTAYFGTTAVAVSANGPDVTVPNNAYVTPAVAWQNHQSPNAAVAKGLAAGVCRPGSALCVGQRRKRRRT